MRMLSRWLGRLCALAAIGCAASSFANSATEPVPGDEGRGWTHNFDRISESLKTGPSDIVFIGDSITHFWNPTAVSLWNERFAPLGAANLGIAGDQTQHVLWRLQNGHFDGLNPKAAVIMIGTNNLGWNTPDEIAAGVEAIVSEVKTRAPNCRILLLAIFPRRDVEGPILYDLEEVNRILKETYHGQTVQFMDIGQVFLDENGDLSREVMWDLLHLTKEGYRRWADAIETTLRELLADYRFPRK